MSEIVNHNGILLVQNNPPAPELPMREWLFSLGFDWVPWEVTCDHDEYCISLERDCYAVVSDTWMGLKFGVRRDGRTLYFLDNCTRPQVEGILKLLGKI